MFNDFPMYSLNFHPKEDKAAMGVGGEIFVVPFDKK